MPANTETHPCEFCGKPVTKTKAEQSQRKYWTCGGTCSNKLTTQRRRDEWKNVNPYRGQQETRPCAICGTSITRYLSPSMIGAVWTCSRACASKRNAAQRAASPPAQRVGIDALVQPLMEQESGDRCPVCDHPYGKRKRCYRCTPAKQKTGESRTCKTCGKAFYAARWQLQDGAVYCSRACTYQGMQQNGIGYRRTRWDGYIEVYYPSHPDATKSGRMLEHRLVAEQKYGRRLTKNEQVHHINGVRDDNRPENLEIIDPVTHSGISNKRGADLRRAMRAELEQLRAELAAYRARYGPLPEE